VRGNSREFQRETLSFDFRNKTSLIAFTTFTQRSNLLIFRPGGGETARFDITTFVQSYRLQTRGQSQQEVRLQGRTRKHEDLPLRG